LNVLESGGMGEGWGDFMATAIRLKASDTRAKSYPMGAWINNSPAGIRAYPYSTSLTTNPHTYTDANGMTSVHAIGTIWATMLYEGKISQLHMKTSNGILTQSQSCGT
jgi:extracellular elastinolytic metalloproteinase